MSNKKSLADHSRIDWLFNPGNESGYPGDTNLQLGCLQRIATATEAMAKNHIRLQQEYDWMKTSRDGYMERNARLERANAALRGHLNRLKKQLKPA